MINRKHSLDGFTPALAHVKPFKPRSDQVVGAHSLEDLNRRDFLKSSSATVLMAMAGGVKLVAAEPAATDAKEPVGPKLKVGVIGLGSWGRELVNTLLRHPKAEVAALCDNYPAFLKRCGSTVPSATQVADYKALLANAEIPAVIVSTPTHQHRQIVLAALEAGKHVYCEAPLASTVEDARAIAQAAKARPELVFQSGLQLRSDPQRLELIKTFRTGALGEPVMARAQWHKKLSWRQSSPKPEREKELNWRLDKSISTGLLGEIASHHFDQAMWFLNKVPSAITALGRIAFWNDGRDVEDTVQAIVEFPGGICMSCDVTLANSFDGDYEVYFGSDSAVMLRQSDVWLFKEVDAKLLGWEVYFPKQQFLQETGIVLKVGASKSVAGQPPTEEEKLASTPLYCALNNFLRNAADFVNGREDFIAMAGDDPAGLKEHLATKVQKRPAAGWLEGYRAAVLGIKANEAVVKGNRITIEKDLFNLA